MRRTLYDEDHEAFRRTCRAFMESEVVPHHEEWERDGIVPRQLWKRAGALGLIGFMVPEEHGGAGVDDFRFNAVLNEELTRVGASGPGFCLHNDVVAPYLLELSNDEQRARWLPGFCTGQIITAIAMSEPAAGSDLQGTRTTARRAGDGYRLNGQKTFITNGINADVVVVVAKTDPDAGHRGISLLVVERGMPGFERGRKLEKIGLHAQDTAELFFDDVLVPFDNLLGEEGQGFRYLMERLPQERLCIAVTAAAACRRFVDLTVAYCRERRAFGASIGSFQATRFTLAELATKADVVQVYIDRCVQALVDGELTAVDAAKAKWWSTELQKETVDACLQLFGGYGFMAEYPIARAFLDARVQTIYGGTTEIMKEIIGRDLDLR